MFFAPSKSREREQKFRSWVYQRPVIISKSRSKCQTPVRNLQRPPKPQMRTEGHGCSLHLQNQDREPKFGSWVYQRPVTISKSRSRCQTPSQEPPASSKAPNQDLKDMEVLCTFKIEIESQNLDHGCFKNQ